MKLLVITNLFPNALEPNRGLFNKQQILELARRSDVKVIAPVPWCPRSRALERVTRWSARARVPARERIDGLEVYHPRCVVIPKMGRALYGWLFLWGIERTVRDLHRVFPFDRILATWAYPDVWAAAAIAQRMRLPLVAKLHGSDINLLAGGFWRGRMIRSALRRSRRVVAVSEAMKAAVVRLGVREQQVTVIPNGVDPERFRPMDQAACRARLGLSQGERIILFIGHLVPVKGIADLVEAFRACQAKASVHPCSLLLVGDGALREAIRRRITILGLRDRVRLIGPRPHEEIPLWLNAADVLCLPSLHEGCPNVVIEALACGRPVVATAVGGVPELLSDSARGILVPPRDPAALADGLARSLTMHWDTHRIRQAIVERTWRSSAAQLETVLRHAANGHERDG
ncbi:MAG: glycosyltransferase family 4 protein [Candidatus Omnitrophica bacterium]|nr:glycosyltransferase family 4 protein [Candidatus Omnitrophota bacterium]